MTNYNVRYPIENFAKENVHVFTYSPVLDFALDVNPVKEDPCLPMLVRAADFVGVEPTNVSILVVVPDVKPRSCSNH